MKLWGEEPGNSDEALKKAANLGDLENVEEALDNLGVIGEDNVYTKAQADAKYLTIQGNLSDLDDVNEGLSVLGGMNASLNGVNAAAARSALDIYSIDESNDAYLLKFLNFSDVIDKPEALENIGAADNLLSNITDKVQARLNMDLMSDDEVLTYVGDNFLSKYSNLAELINKPLALSTIGGMNSSLTGVNAAAALTNLGAQSSATTTAAIAAASALALSKTDNLASLQSAATARANMFVTEAVTRSVIASNFSLLNNRPFPSTGALGTGTHIKDRWVFIPFSLNTSLAVSSIGLTVTAVASGGTAAAIFALFTMNTTTGKPSALQTDYSSYGTLDLTAGTGLQERTTAGLTLPAGQWLMGWAWTGTAGVSPTLNTILGFHPSVSGASTATSLTGWFQVVSGATPPSPPSATSAGLAGTAIWIKTT